VREERGLRRGGRREGCSRQMRWCGLCVVDKRSEWWVVRGALLEMGAQLNVQILFPQ
jgi:hypothetical protein